MTDLRRTTRTIRSNLIAGILTIIPLIVVWVVLNFIFSFLFAVGSPVEEGFSMFVMDRMPQAAPLFENPVFHWFVAVVIAVLLLYSVGAVASRVVGKRLIAGVEGLIARIPVVETVYSASKKLVNILQQKPDGAAARVVLVEFPTPGMRAIGLVMRVFNDSVTGEELAAVYVPTTPNPTSGYLEILPVRSLLPTSMTMDQAMTMIVSGGAVAPGNLSIAPPARELVRS